MTEDYLIKTMSKERWATYQKLGSEYGLSASELYVRNLTYSKELYVILGGLEVILRNAFQEQLSRHFGKPDWMSDLTLLRRSHKEQVGKAIDKLVQNKSGQYVLPDLIAELSFGFWTHLLDAPYEQELWAPALRKCFPHKFGRPVRKDIESRLKNLLRLRNKIAHLEPIIRYESQLIQAYQNAYDIISWICPKTATWFDEANQFRAYWEQNKPTGNRT